MMLDGPICENVLQSLDMTTPKPRFWKSQDQLLLQDTMESGPPEAPIWAKSDPSSCMIVICINENGVRSAADPPCEYQNEEILWTVVTNWYWGRSRLPIATRCWWCLDIKKACSSRLEKRPLAASKLAESAVTVWQIDIAHQEIWWQWNDDGKKNVQLQKTKNEGISLTVVTNRYLTVLRI